MRRGPLDAVEREAQAELHPLHALKTLELVEEAVLALAEGALKGPAVLQDGHVVRVRPAENRERDELGPLEEKD